MRGARFRSPTVEGRMGSRRKKSEGGTTTLVRVPIVPVPLVPASPEQREKVARQSCVVCGRRPADPAHLVPQRLGGCASPDCVIPLCRTHHRLYDDDLLALAPFLGRGFRREKTHALVHTTPRKLKRALKGAGWTTPRK
jgi:HNH endonuclease